MNVKKLFMILIIIPLALFVLSTIGLLIIYEMTTFDVKLDVNMFGQYLIKTEIYDNNNRQIENVSTYVEYTDYSKISKHAIMAFIAVEDKRFFKHSGIDYYGIMRAIINNLKHMSVREGGSTISQQLAKNTLLSNEKTLKRKFKEIKLAKLIEKNFTKHEILTMYLNVIYFGDSIYGITKAADSFFCKKPSELTIAEASMLAGIIKNPLKYSPLNDIDCANGRKNVVLKLLHNDGKITQNEFDEAKQFLNILNQSNNHISNESYIRAVLNEASILLNMSEREILSHGYIINTYLDKNLQQHAETTIRHSHFDVNNAKKSVIITDNKTSGIIAFHSQIKHSIFKFRRSPASILKPIIVYAPALDMGLIVPDTPVIDKPITINNYSPKNYNDYYIGQTNIRDSLRTSSNVVSVELLNQTGIDASKKYAEALGIKFNNDNGLSLALGAMTHGCTLVEIVESYMSIANAGLHSKASFIKSIKNKEGGIVYKANHFKNRVLSKGASYLLTDMLRDVAKTGTAKKLSSLNIDIASKTGTHGDNTGNSDAWNISYTASNTVCVWYGSKLINSKKMDSKITGGTFPTLLAMQICKMLPGGIKFEKPDEVIELDIDQFVTKKTMKIVKASYFTPQEYRKSALFIDKFKPNEVSNYFDDALQIGLKVEIIDYLKVIRFTTLPEFKYKLFRCHNNYDSLIYDSNGIGSCEAIDNFHDNGIIAYYVKVYDTNNIYIGSTPKIHILSF